MYRWKDPFTTAYTAYEQRKPESKLNKQFETRKPTRRPVVQTPTPPKPRQDDVQREARRYRLASSDGDAVARLRIPQLGLNAVVVNGTGVPDLRRGPGRHLETPRAGARDRSSRGTAPPPPGRTPRPDGRATLAEVIGERFMPRLAEIREDCERLMSLRAPSLHR